MVVREDTSLQQPIIQDVEIFLGIRYAEPPLRELRFRAPRPYTSQNWTATRPMVTPGEKCFQISGSILTDTGSTAGHEDCLFLNVYRPSAAEIVHLPVMFWIYGGGYVDGDASSFNGTALAALHNVIVVTVNYRLGHIGFLGSQSSLSEEGTTGNWGTLDTQLGLKWVQQNIEAFGGDKNRVLLFGESAGAFSVMWHIAAPGSKGLFHAAIVQSGTASTPMFFQTRTDAFRYYDWVASELAGCKDANDLACLREVDFHNFTIPNGIRFDPARAPPWGSPLFPAMPVGPIIDGTALPDNPLRMVENGLHNDVPVILGVNKNEGSMFGLMLPKLIPGLNMPLAEDGVRKAIYHFVQNETAVEELLELYHFERYSSVFGSANGPFEQVFYLIRDIMFHCSARRLADALVDKGKSPIWMYSFDMPNLFGSWAMPSPVCGLTWQPMEVRRVHNNTAQGYPMGVSHPGCLTLLHLFPCKFDK
ncbi:Carboxylesterase 3 precursor, putative [Perkinsus marinus ATCC 50983]|uniref:Carboxylic ester hydrolase n=1 Tax=Perkinsus marinus (strain ATCC 50983 / TXsc) TaxID=423536 RepID=C5KHP2_PERM5|nr:Carboxylesterase 3 precursor, putative [Perkinsus marinus ATCC 50983]EER16104.1 Carboxylesterase 3 precursor, putative [Perkinsus marinus ATCC 50983]|eukprot:XP_002784308.1 Carboxylesterase 3 precursor, putative [Perkinsus marinus ATCC 50983]